VIRGRDDGEEAAARGERGERVSEDRGHRVGVEKMKDAREVDRGEGPGGNARESGSGPSRR
jgi:hypothetical protein